MGLSNHVSNICILSVFFPSWYPSKGVYRGDILQAKVLSESFTESRCLTWDYFCFRHTFLKVTLSFIWSWDKKETGNREEYCMGACWGYFRDRRNTLIGRQLKIEGRLYLSEGEKRGKKLFLTSATRKRRGSTDLSGSQRGGHFVSLPPGGKKHEIQSGERDCYCSVIKVVYQDYSVASMMLSEGNKTQRVVPCLFFWAVFSLQLWWDSSLLHTRWLTGRQKGSWSINTHPQPLCKTLEALRHLLLSWWWTLSAL